VSDTGVSARGLVDGNPAIWSAGADGEEVMDQDESHLMAAIELAQKAQQSYGANTRGVNPSRLVMLALLPVARITNSPRLSA